MGDRIRILTFLWPESYRPAAISAWACALVKYHKFISTEFLLFSVFSISCWIHMPEFSKVRLVHCMNHNTSFKIHWSHGYTWLFKTCNRKMKHIIACNERDREKERERERKRERESERERDWHPFRGFGTVLRAILIFNIRSKKTLIKS